MTTSIDTVAPAGSGGTDLLGRPLTADEHAILSVYGSLREALSRDLPPCAAANIRAALAPVAVAVADLGLRYEHLTDLSV
ncbi:hypothetical protein [Saccharopolyspora shandongensis]|uniref:hypothetical protein n=1 Tax=Saccharopolyspora shandongensis TaxID=418495 RepID=UPI0033FC54A3